MAPTGSPIRPRSASPRPMPRPGPPPRPRDHNLRRREANSPPVRRRAQVRPPLAESTAHTRRAPMNISRLFVLLPVSSLPDVDYPTIQVQTFYPGASPQVMATTVTAPLEVQLGQIPGLTQMTSASSAGASIITLQFSLALSLDIAEQNVQEAINAANS